MDPVRKRTSAWARNGVGLAIFLIIWLPLSLLPIGDTGRWVIAIIGIAAGLIATHMLFGPRASDQLSGPVRVGRFCGGLALHAVAMVIAGINVIFGFPPINWIAAAITKLADALDPEF